MGLLCSHVHLRDYQIHYGWELPQLSVLYCHYQLSNMVVFYNERNIHTLQGLQTRQEEEQPSRESK